MAGSKPRKLIAIVLVIVLALGLGLYTLWQPARNVDEGWAGDTPSPSAAESPPLETGDTKAAAADPVTRPQNPRPRGNAEVPVEQGPEETEVRIPHNVVLDDYKAGLWQDIQANPPTFAWPGDPAIDADQAYRLYMYYGNCSVLISRGERINQQIDRIASRAEDAGERSLRRLEGRLDRIIDYYELCLPIPADVDARREAVTWMTEAVRLGHEIAEVQFYEKAMGFILRPDPNTNNPPLAMKEPVLVEDFKITARMALSRALEKGHPEAYLARSQAVLEGLIYTKDPVLAYAYARAAEQEAARNQILLEDLGHWKAEAAKYLDRDQLAEAEQLVQDLVKTGSG